MDRKFAMRQDATDFYTLLGNSEGPTLLFLHGFLGNRNDFQPLAQQFSADYQLLMVDLPGHGTSIVEDPSSYTMKSCAESIIALLKTLNVTKAYLIGYSMGGRLGLYLSLHYPDFFQKSLLISASPGICDDQERERRREKDGKIAAQLREGDFNQFLVDWYGQELFSSLKKAPGLQQKIIEARKKNSPRHLALSLEEMGTGSQTPLWDRLADTPIPIDLVVGSVDKKFVTIGEEMVRHNPSMIQMHQIEEAGHLVHQEKPEAFSLLVKKLCLF